MRLYRILLLLLICVAPWVAAAQPSSGGEQGIGMLSPDDAAAYRAGKSMGGARVAERNRYPAPKHVLELADTLGLTVAQRKTAQAVYERVRTEATAAGEGIVDAERRLDSLFKSGSAAAPAVDRIVAEIAGLNQRLRMAHLHGHIEMRAVLTAAQIDLYESLRMGPGSGGGRRSK